MKNRIYIGVLVAAGLVILVVVWSILMGSGVVEEVRIQPSAAFLAPALPTTMENRKVLQSALSFNAPMSMYAAGAMQQHSIQEIIFDLSVPPARQDELLEQIEFIYLAGFAYVGEVALISEHPLTVRKVFVVEENNPLVVYHIYNFNNCLIDGRACLLTGAVAGVAHVDVLPLPIRFEDFLTNEEVMMEEEFFPIGAYTE